MSKEEMLILCACSNIEHQLYFTKFSDDTDFVYINVHLNQCGGLLKRFWDRLKYLFGYDSRWGAFDELVLSREDKERLLKFLAE